MYTYWTSHVMIQHDTAPGEATRRDNVMRYGPVRYSRQGTYWMGQTRTGSDRIG